MSSIAVVYTPRARRQLAAIERYIARKSSAERAAGFIDRIITRCDRLALGPYQGERLDHLRSGARKAGLEGRVTIIFKVDTNAVTILAVSYAGREFDKDLTPAG